MDDPKKKDSFVPSPNGTSLESGGNVQYETMTMWDKRPKKYKNVIIEVCSFVLMMELAERLSYFGINQGLKNFMQEIGWSLSSASSLKSTWTSLCYMSPLFGAYIADEKWGRFRVIMVFGVWYAAGEYLVAISAYPSIKDNHALSNVIFLVGLFLGIGIGTGAIKSNVITLGADQFDPNDPNEEKQKLTFFNYFYFCINIGSCFAYGYLSVLCVDGSAQIPANYGYFATFLICAGVMTFALCVLIIGYPRYVHRPPQPGAMSTLCSVLYGNMRYSRDATILVSGTFFLLIAFAVNLFSAFLSEFKVGEVLSYIAGCFVLMGIVCWVWKGRDSTYLDKSKLSHGGIYDDDTVNSIKKVVRVLPFASFTIIWQCAYDQIDANFQAITQQCDLRLDTSKYNSSQIPGAMLGVFDPLAVLILIPILDTFVYPAYRRMTGKRPSAFGKCLVGLAVATTVLFWAGFFEMIRRGAGPLDAGDYGGEQGHPILDKGSKQPMNDISWAAVIPNYALVALAECLVNVTAYDIFYSEVPLNLKSTCQAINLFMTCMGSIAASVFTIMFKPYIPNNLNDGHLEYMYFTMGCISVVNLVVFLYVMIQMQLGMLSDEEEKFEEELILSESRSSSRASFAASK